MANAAIDRWSEAVNAQVRYSSSTAETRSIFVALYVRRNMTASRFARLIGDLLGWALAGLLIAFAIVYNFVNGDMLFGYYATGMILGGVAGAIFAALTHERTKTGSSEWSPLLLRAALSGASGWIVIALIWLAVHEIRAYTSFREMAFLALMAVGCAVVLGGVSSFVDRRV